MTGSEDNRSCGTRIVTPFLYGVEREKIKNETITTALYV